VCVDKFLPTDLDAAANCLMTPWIDIMPLSGHIKIFSKANLGISCRHSLS